MKLSLEKKTTFIFFLVAIPLICILVMYYNNTKQVKLTSDSVEHTQEVLHKSDNILLDILNIETGSRGYILTGNVLFLVPFNDAVANINKDLEELSSLTSDNPKQHLRIDSLKKITLSKLADNNNDASLKFVSN